MSELENLPLKEDKIKLGFETETVTLQINEIIPLKVVAPNIREKVKYKQIFASIKEAISCSFAKVMSNLFFTKSKKFGLCLSTQNKSERDIATLFAF